MFPKPAEVPVSYTKRRERTVQPLGHHKVDTQNPALRALEGESSEPEGPVM